MYFLAILPILGINLPVYTSNALFHYTTLLSKLYETFFLEDRRRRRPYVKEGRARCRRRRRLARTRAEMNDSLFDELENEDTPYEPLLNNDTNQPGTAFSPRNPGEEDIWAELGEHPPQSNSLTGSENSLKDRIMQSLAEKGRTLKDASQNVTNYTSLRKPNMPSGFNLVHGEGGGNVPDAHGNVSNLDAFFSSLYNYYYHKGFQSIVISGVVSLLNLLFIQIYDRQNRRKM